MSTPSMPRPLKYGEYYCHRCEKFVPTVEYDKHAREHEKFAQKKTVLK